MVVSKSKSQSRSSTATPSTKRAASRAAPAEEVVAEPVPAVEPEAVQDTTDADGEVEDGLLKTALSLQESYRVMQEMFNKQFKQLRSFIAEVRKAERNIRKHEKRAAKKSRARAEGGNANKGVQQPKPVYSSTMKSFFEKYHTMKDRKGNVICDELHYDDDGHLLVSRDQALKLVTSYVRENNLQQYENKRRIKMDATLTSLFPELAAQTDKKGKVINEENMYFHTIMKALSPHFRTE